MPFWHAGGGADAAQHIPWGGHVRALRAPASLHKNRVFFFEAVPMSFSSDGVY